MHTTLRLMLFAVAITVTLPAFGKDAKPDTRLVVSVTAAVNADGFTDPSKDRQDSAKDIAGKLKGSKVVRLAADGETPTIRIEVLGRGAKQGLNALGSTNKSTVLVRLTAGDFVSELSAEAGKNGMLTDYKGAAGKIAKQVEAWVKANDARLRASLATR